MMGRRNTSENTGRAWPRSDGRTGRTKISTGSWELIFKLIEDLPIALELARTTGLTIDGLTSTLRRRAGFAFSTVRRGLVQICGLLLQWAMCRTRVDGDMVTRGRMVVAALAVDIAIVDGHCRERRGR